MSAIKIRRALGAVAAGALMASAYPTMSGAQDAETITIGVVAPFSGPGANYGDQLRKGLDLALDEVNADGGILIGDKQVKLVIDYCDDRNTSSQSVICGRRLASDGVKIVVTATSVASLPLVGFNEEAGFLLLGASHAPAMTTQGNKLVVRSWPDPETSDMHFAKLLFDIVNSDEDKVERAAMMVVSTDVGTSFLKQFTEGWEAAGGTVTGRAPYSIEDTDFAPQIQNLLSGKPDAIVLTTICSTSALVINQARQLGFEGIFLSSSACPGGEALTRFVKPDDFGNYYSEAFPSSFVVGENVLPFVGKFEAAYGSRPTEVSAGLGYMQAHWAAQALAEAGGIDDLEKLKEAFGPALSRLTHENTLGLRDFDPVTGNTFADLAVALTSPETDGQMIRADK